MADLAPLWLSLQVAAAATAVIVALGLPDGLVLARIRFPGKGLVAGLLVLPLVLPPTVLGYLLLLLLGRRTWLGGWLEQGLGIVLVFHWSGAVLASAVAAFPLFLLPARGAFEAVDPALEDVARLLGRGELSVFRAVTLPLAWRGLAAGVVLAFARALGDFGATMMVAGNIPGLTQTASLAIYDAVQAGDSVPRGVADPVDLPGLDRGPLARAADTPGARAGPVSEAAPELEVRLVRRIHGDLTLDLTIRLDREIGVLFGPSGAGKTSILRLITGLARPDEGSIRLGDSVLFDSARSIDEPLRRRRIGMIFQDDLLFPHLSVAANIGFGLNREGRAGARPVSRKSRPSAASDTCSTGGRPASPAGSGSAWGWPARWHPGRGSPLRRAGLGPRPAQSPCPDRPPSRGPAVRGHSGALRDAQPRRGDRAWGRGSSSWSGGR